MRLSEVIERYPATVRLYAVPVNQHGFNLFLIRTASNVHGQGRAGVSVGKGSGARMNWTPEHVAAAAVRCWSCHGHSLWRNRALRVADEVRRIRDDAERFGIAIVMVPAWPAPDTSSHAPLHVSKAPETVRGVEQ